MADYTIALAGNPNSGKTSLFNALTGSRQHVGNWPGVTVEKKEGVLQRGQLRARVVDLPGTYALRAQSPDEAIARDFILNENPDVVINVVDASNIERNLYLTSQLLEMGADLVVALNMFDEARAAGTRIDVEKLSELLRTPVVPTVATHREGLKDLVDTAFRSARGRSPEKVRIDYGCEIEEELAIIEAELRERSLSSTGQSLRWIAIKLLEHDPLIMKSIGSEDPAIVQQVERSRAHILQRTGQSAEDLVADRRYGFVAGLVAETVTRRTGSGFEVTTSDRIDRVVLHRAFGIPIFILAMWAVFQFTFKVSAPLVEMAEEFTGWLGSAVGPLMEGAGLPDVLVSMVTDGLIAGVGSVMAFIPPIFLLFLALSFLEDTGYMARAAFIMDRFMHAMGLHGKSSIPMIMGFGCNVTGILATRTLESPRDRLVTILVNPLMSCSARLPIYVMFASALFPSNQGLVVFSLYFLGIVLAVIVGKILSRVAFSNQSSPFVMELPPYRVPSVFGLFVHMWERGKAFIQKAGTIILLAVVIIWALSNLPFGVEYASEESLVGRIGAVLAPIFRPAGFGTWQAAVSLLFGIIAKEIVVGTLGVVYGVGEMGLSEAIRMNWTPLSAVAFMVMTLVYVPCIATIAAIRRETNSLGWTLFSVGYSIALGWALAVGVYQIGMALGFR